MYDLLMKGCMIAIIIVGLLMVIAPQKMGKQPLRDTQKGRMIIRLTGAGFAVLGLVGLLAIWTLL